MAKSCFLLASIISLSFLDSCFMGSPERKNGMAVNQMVEYIHVIQDTLVKLTDLEPGDILVKPNMNWFPGSSMVNGGRGFGHAVLVIEGGKDTNTMNLLEKIRIFESQARHVPESFQLRSASGFLDGDDFRFANTTFGMQNAGFRYRLRFDLTPSQRDSIIKFVMAQDQDSSSWRSLKRIRTNIKGNRTETLEDKKTWYCSLLIWEAFYQVLGVDLDPNGGLIVFPNDLISSPYFDNDAIHKQKRVRF
jgi:hypothetical protein